MSDSSDTSSISISSSNIAINELLFGAIRAREWENVREILSQEDEGGRDAVTDDDIHEALLEVARVSGSVDACRLLWGKLSRRGKRMYFATTIQRMKSPLHVAVRLCNMELVCLFILEFKWNINQKDPYLEKTPLCFVQNLETAHFLLENGANVNQGGKYGPLWFAVHENNTEVVRLLLVEYQANPNLNRTPVDVQDTSHPWYPSNTDRAILHGNAEILRLLLEHGAFIGHILDARRGNRSSLNVLLCYQQTSLETKLTICRMLIEHSTEDHATAAFMQASFEFAVKQTDNNEVHVCCQTLLDAGIDPRMSMYCAIRANNLSICQLLVHVYQVDPFLQQENNENDDDSDETSSACSSFLAAARLPDTSLFEYFLGIWDSRFSSTGGKNSNGDYPIHVVCCDPSVSLQAIRVLVDRQADALAVVDGEQGLLPFHFAANWGASLDVIFYLLQHCPNALRHAGNAVAVSAATESGPRPSSSFPAAGASGSMNGMVNSSSDDSTQQNARGPVKKKAKTGQAS